MSTRIIQTGGPVTASTYELQRRRLTARRSARETRNALFHVGNDAPSDNAVPGGVVLLVELLLDVGGNILRVEKGE